MADLNEQLPDGYYFVDETTITPEDVIDLRDAADWGTERNVELWRKVIDQSMATVGIRNSTDLLVGVGFLAGNIRHAILCDFVVHPDHRGIGLGRSILSRRINIADAFGIPYLYTELSKTNTLKTYYESLGFKTEANLYGRAARRHPDEL